MKNKVNLNSISTKFYINLVKKYFEQNKIDILVESLTGYNYDCYNLSDDFVTIVHKTRYYGKDAYDYFFNINCEGLTFGFIDERKTNNIPSNIYKNPPKNKNWEEFFQKHISQDFENEQSL